MWAGRAVLGPLGPTLALVALCLASGATAYTGRLTLTAKSKADSRCAGCQYPGIRSDTDAFTMGYSFTPWKGRESITSGDSLRTYNRDLEFNVFEPETPEETGPKAA